MLAHGPRQFGPQLKTTLDRLGTMTRPGLLTRVFVATAIAGLVPALALAMWAYVEADTLIADSDLVVVGTLVRLYQWTEHETDYAIGRIDIEHVLAGVPPQSDFVRLKWDNPSGLLCPRVSHADVKGRKALWLLAIDQDGNARADYPRRSLPLDDIKKVTEFTAELQPLKSDAGSAVRQWLKTWTDSQIAAKRSN